MVKKVLKVIILSDANSNFSSRHMYMVQLNAVDLLLANTGEMSQRRHAGL